MNFLLRGFFASIARTIFQLTPVIFFIQPAFHYFASMAIYTDQLGRTVQLIRPPKRIVSLVPSQTELLFHLGLDEEVVGITKFCVHPKHWLQCKTKIGGTKQIDTDLIDRLRPDLVIANKEENVRVQVEAIEKKYPVWISDVDNLDSALNMIVSIGELVDRKINASIIAKSITENFPDFQSGPTNRFRTAYFIWKEPFMVAGGNTFINDMMQRCGFDNIFSDRLRYPAVTIQDINSSNCELLLLSSEPYPFKEKHMEELQALIPNTSILLVDGEMFSWYGSRILRAPAYFKQLQNQVLSLSHARGTE
jgi:ABC-type Fe3+-hydroxamate transport system substrate-binding protein